MSSHTRLPLLPVVSVRGVGLMACLVLGIGCSGKPDTKSSGADQAAGAEGGGKPLIALIRAADWMGSEWGEDAIKVGLQESDLEAGRDYEIKISSAQGDLATLPSLIDAAIDAKAKVIVALQDATLQAAVQHAKSRADRLPPPVRPVRGRRRHQRLQPSPQRHRRLFAGFRRSGTDPAGGPDPADRAQGTPSRRALQPGGAAVRRLQGPVDGGCQEGRPASRRGCR